MAGETKFIKGKIKNNIQITPKEQQILDEYNEIESVLNELEENIEISDYAKQLIETIHIIHRLPKHDRINKKAEFVFSDGKNQRGDTNIKRMRDRDLSAGFGSQSFYGK